MTTNLTRVEFDESWYLANYPDIAAAYAVGRIKNLENHYRNYGQKEGRLPRAPDGQFSRVFSYGAYGSNNVGDEAILDGVRRSYPECIQLYINKPRNGPAVDYNEPLRQKEFFQKSDYLIIGGGGLLYDRSTVELMLNYARSAKDAGATVDILRLGCEAAHESYHDIIRELFSVVRFASVRTTTSQRIIQDITGRKLPVQSDFAFQLSPYVSPAMGSLESIPSIGIVLASIDKRSLEIIGDGVSKYLAVGSSTPAEFVFIPHSKSYFDSKNNDCTTAELLWSHLGKSNGGSGIEWSRFRVAEFTNDPLTVLEKYRRLDGVISLRFHGLIFGHLTRQPILALGANLIKIKSFLDDYPSPSTFGVQTLGNFSDALASFYSHVMATRLRVVAQD
jgi:polysaccharide pyruvyl transferase WcaK-like protein